MSSRSECDERYQLTLPSQPEPEWFTREHDEAEAATIFNAERWAARQAVEDARA